MSRGLLVGGDRRNRGVGDVKNRVSPKSDATQSFVKQNQKKRKQRTKRSAQLPDRANCCGCSPQYRNGTKPGFEVAARIMWVNLRNAVKLFSSGSRHCPKHAGGGVGCWSGGGVVSGTEPVKLSADVAAVVKQWRPHKPVDETQLETVLPTARAWVTTVGPKDKQEAGRMMRAVTGLLMWADSAIGTTDPATVLHPDNVELWSMKINMQHKPRWRVVTRSVLRRVGRTINPDGWPTAPKPIKRPPPPAAYTATEEQIFKLVAGLSGRRNRAARMWVTAASLGAGMSGPEIACGHVDDVIEVGDRLAIQVQGRHPRLVPVRREWTDTLTEAVQAVQADQADRAANQTMQPDDAMSGRFIQSTSNWAALNIAKHIAPVNGEALSFHRTRTTWLTAHICARTPIAVLPMIAGPLSMMQLDKLAAAAVGTPDRDTAYLWGFDA